jgi:magnesium transporter
MKARARHRRAPGAAPGTFATERVQAAPQARVEIVDYSATRMTDLSNDVATLDAPIAAGAVRWIHVVGVPSLGVLERLRKTYSLDPLALEDVVTVGQRPKFNEYEKHLFVTLLIPTPGEPGEFEQLSVFANKQLVVSFHDGTPADLLDPIRRRFANDNSLIRANDGNFLLYAMIDLAVDHLFPVIDDVGVQMSDLETGILERTEPSDLAKLHEMRNRVLLFRRTAWATREILADLFRHLDSAGSDRSYLRPYLQDCYDHIVSVIDLLEMHREVTTSLVEVYLSLVSNRLNDVMRVLTMIATLFIPSTFLVGVYGMNFDRDAGPWSMPELGWPYGYIAVVIICIASMIGMLIFFRRKHWI